MSESSTTKGILLAVLSCLLWGSVFIFARFLLGSPSKIDPYSLVFFRFSTASVLLLLYARYKKQPLLPSSWKQFYGMVKTGIFLYWLMSILFFIGQRNVTAMTASLFIESGPAIILIIWKIISRQKTTKIEIIACVIGFIGSMLVLNIISPNGLHLTGNPWGILCVFLSAVSWVIGGYHGKDLMRGGSRITAVAWCMLICALLDTDTVTRYLDICKNLDLAALVEAHDEAEIASAVRAGARMIGVNNRNLKDFSVDLGNAARLREHIPAGTLYVAESGVKTPSDAAAMNAIGADAVLMGEVLMRAADKKAALAAMREAAK